MPCSLGTVMQLFLRRLLLARRRWFHGLGFEGLHDANGVCLRVRAVNGRLTLLYPC